MHTQHSQRVPWLNGRPACEGVELPSTNRQSHIYPSHVLVWTHRTCVWKPALVTVIRSVCVCVKYYGTLLLRKEALQKWSSLKRRHLFLIRTQCIISQLGNLSSVHVHYLCMVNHQCQLASFRAYSVESSKHESLNSLTIILWAVIVISRLSGYLVTTLAVTKRVFAGTKQKVQARRSIPRKDERPM